MFSPDLLTTVLRWWSTGASVALASVTATAGSAPRPVGTAMLVGPDGSVTGGVSAGCVDAAVLDLCHDVLRTGATRFARFGDGDDDVFAPGLTCGGTVEVFVQRLDRTGAPDLDRLAAALRQGRPVAAVTCVDGPAASRGRWLLVDGGTDRGTLGDAALDAAAGRAGRAALADGWTRLVRPSPDVSLLVRGFTAPPRMIIFGVSDFTAAVARQGRFLGYQVTVCDARAVFTTAERFPDADDVVVDWPHRYLSAEAAAGRVDDRTVLCVLTHDPKFDVPLLRVALDLPVAYVGAMGSRRSTADRRARLLAAGVPDAALARLRAPIGLDLGARTPEQTAVSIAAEIVATGSGRTGGWLTAGTGPIHDRADDADDADRVQVGGRSGRSPGGEPQRQEEVHPVLEPAQVTAGQPLDPVDPVPQRVDVHV
ncbi:XdhC family protein [Solwaraspora sp. WMMD791]|uniref:XdhC family protein n=1 Tax=Solwaraspora sp. WMMD791 TaxID=3016086 RepID=UPI00249AEB78|nr:XdhC/CoxI family protein [Solwaraspora sp. WMMD791]WFE28300.1 XdhC family protein [Solwaraspora sp. WMMD791]